MEKILKGIIYRLMKLSAKIGLHFFYRGIEKNGKENIPRDGTPFIYAVNHQNAFLDAVIVGGISPIPTYFMTRSDVFKPPFDWFLDALKMMPIYRIRDGYASLHKNTDIFDTCKDLLEDRNAILIFPEGNHGIEYYLRSLTKGIGRIALQAEEQLDMNIKIIPVGLNYFDHYHSGNKLIINYGPSLDVKSYMPAYKEHKQKALRKFIQDLSKGMQDTLVIPQNSDNYESEKPIFNRNYEGLDYAELQTHLAERKPIVQSRSLPRLATLGRLFGILNFPPLLLTKWIVDTKVSQKIFTASIKIAIVIIIFPIWLLLSFVVMTLMTGWLWGLGLVLLQIVTLLIRRELVRLGRK